MRKCLVLCVSVVVLVVVVVFFCSRATERDIAAHATRVKQIAQVHRPLLPSQEDMERLPQPVQAYVRFVFQEQPHEYSFVTMTLEGAFRRPQAETFEPTTAEQTTAIGEPALVFSATTPILPGIWARAYDAFLEGRMEMKAKIMSTVTVVNENKTEALDKTSLRRWLLESPLYPVALLPGGPVRWEAIDDRRARAVVTSHGATTSLVATFRQDGSLERFDAEEDGDLTTAYHGSGEHVTRSDYRLVNGMMIPFAFSIARVAKNQIYPFWVGRITELRFQK